MDRFRLGAHTRQISTTSEEAQRFFDLGLNWCYGFNHEEGLKCFRKVIELDPECVMAYWGVAYASGPFYNYPWCQFGQVEAQVCTKLCHDAVGIAQRLAVNGSDVENELVEALAARFQKPHAVAPEGFDRWDDDYRDAMRLVYERHPDDHDVMALFAEALITRTPWKLWDVKTGLPASGADTVEALAVCERSIALAEEQNQPPNPAILHLHIHILEMSDEPERAMASADALGSMCPDAGHLNHMPGHIYTLCGEYELARVASIKAIRADDLFVDYAGPFNFYTAARCHDLHLMMYTCMFMGHYNEALDAADRICETLTEEVLSVNPESHLAITLEGYYSMRMHVLIRFGRWLEIIDAPMPANPDLYCVSTATHHYAKGIAHSALGNVGDAQMQQRKLRESKERIPPDRLLFNNTASSVLAIAESMLDGELAYRIGNHAEAFEHLRDAVQRDDDLAYTEPWAWMHPPRHALAALLMEQQHYDEAEAVYRSDLGMDHTLQRCSQHPDNVWSLHGLVECLERRGETTARADLEKKLVLAMANTDVPVTSSCMCRTDVASPSCCSDE